MSSVLFDASEGAGEGHGWKDYSNIVICFPQMSLSLNLCASKVGRDYIMINEKNCRNQDL